MEKIDYNSIEELEVSTVVRKFLQSCNDQSKKGTNLSVDNLGIWFELQLIGVNSLNKQMQQLIENGFANQNRIVWRMYRDTVINTWNNWIFPTDDIAFPADIMGIRHTLKQGLEETINLLRERDFDLSGLKK